MQRILIFLLVITMLLSYGNTYSTASDYKVKYHEFAEKLSSIGVFRGTDKGFELDRQPTRLEGLVMLLRLIGKEDEVLEMADGEASQFSDVPVWGVKYTNYAYRHGLTKGIGNGLFGASDVLNSKQYHTFLLRALGYDDSKGDFRWDQSDEFMKAIGVISDEYYNDISSGIFMRDHVAKSSYEALFSSTKGSTKTLGEMLVFLGDIDDKVFVAIAPEQEEPIMLETLLVNVVKDGKWGYINHLGEVVIGFSYQDAWPFSEDYACVAIDGKYGYIDTSGNIVIAPQYDEAGPFSEGLAYVKTNEYVGYINKQGDMVIQPRFDYADFFAEGLARVMKDGKAGFINLTGKYVIDRRYDYVNRFLNGVTAFVSDRRVGYLDREGNVLIEPQFDIASDYVDGLLRFNDGNKVGYMSVEEEVIIEPVYDFGYSFSEGLAVVIMNDKYGAVDSIGNEVIPMKYEYLTDFSEGLAIYRENDLFGIIDVEGDIVLEPTFHQANRYGFSEGLAAVYMNFKFGFVNRSGDVVIDFVYDSADHFVKCTYQP